jgi:pimeloyl-ACP methyl ester carboxylesterase
VFPHLEAPDFHDMPFDDRVAMVDTMLTEEPDEPVFLIGSSLGGLMAMHLANQHPKTVKGYVLLAPAPNDTGIPIEHVPAITHMILGTEDEIEGLNTAAVGFAKEFGIPTTLVHDGHRMEHSIPEIVATAEETYKQTEVSMFWGS